MSNEKMKLVSFAGTQVLQGNYVFYLAALPASIILGMGAGLRSTVNRPQPLESEHGEIDQNGRRFIEAIEISEFASEVRQIQNVSYGEEEPFQRIIDEGRVRDIAAYLREENAMMPNAVILATRDTTVVEVIEVDQGKGLYSVKLEWAEEVPTNIIDGQHRLEALRRLIDDGYKEFMSFTVPFTLLLDMPFYMQAEMFAIINGRQKPVNRSRIYDLLGYMPLTDPILREKAYRGEMAVNRFCHHAVKVLNESSRSPWKARIKMRGSGQGIVTQAAFVDHLTRFVIPRKDSKRLTTLPIFYSYFKGNDLVGLARVCALYFLGIQAAWPSYWRDDASLKSSLFGKTNGVAVMFMVLHDLAILFGGPDKVTQMLILQYWKKAPEDRIKEPPAGGGRGYQNEWYEAIMTSIVGMDFRDQVARKSELERAKLKESGGLF